MTGRVAMPPVAEDRNRRPLPLGAVRQVLDILEKSLVVADRSGGLVLVNARARRCLETQGFTETDELNLFSDLLKMDAADIFRQVERGEREVNVRIGPAEKRTSMRIRWMPESDWLVAEIQNADGQAGDSETQLTVQDLLQEREITYRNLLAAYLKLQEVNRQKTVFLASAAHELKTPLAVIKGYYDLLLAGSLGRLTDKQRDILEESKESCERLVRLVSMFLNYSALESGKLVLQLRENDLRDCLDELSKRWFEAFQRKGVRLEAKIDPSIATFRFDYQKVPQVAANLLDNSLKHTPSGGTVVLRAAPHFCSGVAGETSGALAKAPWWRRGAPRNGAPPAAPLCRRSDCASRNCRANSRQPAELFDSRNGMSVWKGQSSLRGALLCAERPQTTSWKAHPGNRANRSRAVARQACRSPVPNSSGTWRPGAPIVRNSLWIPPGCLTACPSAARANPRATSRNNP